MGRAGCGGRRRRRPRAEAVSALRRDPRVLGAAAARGLAVVLEDLHAADRASLLAFELVARSIRSLPVLLLATARDAEARLDPERGDLLARIARESTVLLLGRLGRADVARLMDDLEPAPAAIVDDVYAASGGNPLFVREALRFVRSGGTARSAPEGVGALVAERLARFDPATRDALETAAVLGSEVPWIVLADACGTAEADVRGRLRVPLLAGVLEGPIGDRLAFSHGLFRERLLERLAPARRAELRLRAADALARRGTRGVGSEEEAVAHHLLAALPAGDPARAAEWAARAGERAFRTLAFDRAASFLDGALSALASDPR